MGSTSPRRPSRLRFPPAPVVARHIWAGAGGAGGFGLHLRRLAPGIWGAPAPVGPGTTLAGRAAAAALSDRRTRFFACFIFIGPSAPTCSPARSASCCRAARRPVRGRDRLRAEPRCGAVDHPAVVARARGARPGGSDGVCANVEFPGPGRLVADVVAGVSGIDPRADPWRPGRSVWPLLELIESGAPRCLRAGRRTPQGRLRRYSAARHVAELFDAYASLPPVDDHRLGGRWLDTDGVRRAHCRMTCGWQPELWRRLRGAARRAESGRAAGSRLRSSCAQIRQAVASWLPERLSLFGLTRLPPSQLEVLSALADAPRDCTCGCCIPARRSWEQIASLAPKPAGAAAQGSDRRSGPTTGCCHRSAATLASCSSPWLDAAASMNDTYHPLPPDAGAAATVRAAAAAGRHPFRHSRELGPAARSPPRSQHPGPRLPRAGAPGRGGARRHPRAAGSGPEPGAARHRRHVSRHRDVRAADLGDVRGGRRAVPGCPASDERRFRPPAAAGAARRPFAAPDQSGDERRGDACSSWWTAA